MVNITSLPLPRVMTSPISRSVSVLRTSLFAVASSLLASSGAPAATVTFIGVQPGTSGSGFAAQNWSNPGVAKAFDLAGSEIYGTSGYYQIRPMPWDPGASTIGDSAAAGNNLGITAGSNPTLYSAPTFLSSITGGAGTYVNYGGYPIFRGPDGSALYRQGSLSVSVASGPFNTPSGTNNGYFGEAFSFTMAPGIGADFRIGVAVDTAGNGLYAPDYVSIFNSGSGTVYSSLLTRDGTPDMTFFDVTATAGESFGAAMWQRAGSNSVSPFGLITFDVSRYNLNVTSGVQTNSSVLGGAPAALLKTGAGTTVLTGANTFTGATTISNGAVQLGGSGTLAGGSYAGAVSLATNSSSLAIATTANQTLSGAISGSGSLSKSSTGTLTVSGSNSYSGGTTISGGRVITTSSDALGDASAAITVSGGAYLDVRTNMTRTGTVTFDGGYVATSAGAPASLSKTGGSFVLSNAAEIVAELAGTAGLTSGGTGTSVLWRSNSYTGTTAVNSGTLSLHGAGAISSSSAVVIASGATFNVTGSFAPTNVNRTFAGLTGAGVLYGAGGTVTVNLGSGTNIFTGDIQGGQGLTKAGAGALALGGPSSYTGTTTISEGRIVAAHGSALGSTAAGTLVASGAQLMLSNVTVGNEALTISGSGLPSGSLVAGALRSIGTNTYQGKVTLGADAGIFGGSGTSLTLDVASGDAVDLSTYTLTVDGAGASRINDAIVGAGGLTKSGSANLTLAASNSYSGATTLNAGRITLSGNGRLGSGSITVNTNSAGTLEMAVTGTNVMANNISGAGSLVSSSGETRFTGTVTTTGGLTVSNSTVRIGSGGTAGSYSGSTVLSDAAARLVFDRSDAYTHSGAISGTGGLTKLSAGTTTLTASNSYTGGTTISAGSLVVDGSISSATTVQNGGTLGGSGSVASVSVQNGGTIAPGNSPGTLTLTNGMTWAGGGNYNWQIFGLSGAAGATNTWDLISVTGGTWDITGLSSTNKFNINLWSLAGLPDATGAVAGFDATQNYSWMILASGGLSGTFNTNLFNINTSAINGTGGFVGATGLFSLEVDGNNDLFLNYTGAAAAVPEPGTWAAGGLLLVLAALARRRAKGRTERVA